MPVKLDDKLVVAIASPALFDLAEADRVFREQKLPAYREYMRKNEDKRLEPGTGFPLAKGLLAINELAGGDLLEVLLVLKNDVDSVDGNLNSIENWELSV